MHPLEPIARSSFRPLPSKEGFSLLELLLVVAILSSVAFVVTSTVTNDVSQVRYEDTRNRLTAIRRAIVGSSNPELWAKGLQSGYVVDNGRLPENIDALVRRPGDYETEETVYYFHSYRTVVPLFDNGTTDFWFEEPEHLLKKGHRGSYLFGAFNQIYRDGWGTSKTEDFEENHGWGLDLEINENDDDENDVVEMDVYSFGMNGVSGSPDSSYEEELYMSPSISSNDWQITLTAGVTIRNLTEFDIDLSENGSNAPIKAVFLVYKNYSANGEGLDETGKEYIDTYPDDDKYVYSWDIINSETNETFSLNVDEEIVLNFPANTQIPIGEHLLILVATPAGKDASPDFSTLLTNDETNGESTLPHYVTKRVKFYARGGVPDLVLEIR